MASGKRSSSGTANPLPLKKRGRIGRAEAEQENEIERGSFFRIENYNPPDRPEDVQEPLRSLIGGQECSKPFEKQMTRSDVEDGQYRRLQLWREDVHNHIFPFLNDGRRASLNGDGIPVRAYDSEGRVYDMAFKIWGNKTKSSKSWLYVLFGDGWKSFREDHGLVAIQDFLTLWMFRIRNAGIEEFLLYITSRRLPMVQEKITRR